MEADSSDFVTGAVLSQQSVEDEKWHPVAFFSKSLNAVERNYEIHDKEMLAIIRALEEWRHFLEGAHHKFEIWTDHKNLEFYDGQEIKSSTSPLVVIPFTLRIFYVPPSRTEYGES